MHRIFNEPLNLLRAETSYVQHQVKYLKQLFFVLPISLAILFLYEMLSKIIKNIQNLFSIFLIFLFLEQRVYQIETNKSGMMVCIFADVKLLFYLLSAPVVQLM